MTTKNNISLSCPHCTDTYYIFDTVCVTLVLVYLVYLFTLGVIEGIVIFSVFSVQITNYLAPHSLILAVFFLHLLIINYQIFTDNTFVLYLSFVSTLSDIEKGFLFNWWTLWGDIFWPLLNNDYFVGPLGFCITVYIYFFQFYLKEMKVHYFLASGLFFFIFKVFFVFKIVCTFQII